MKKFLTFILVLAMVLSVSSVAMAFSGEITLNNATHAVSLTVGTDTYHYATLQAAITDAQANPGVITITFLKDISESVVVVQKPGLYLTIDGDGHKMTKGTANGSIEIHGESRHTGTDTLKIQNIVFDIDGDLGGDNAIYDCIHCNHQNDPGRYAHNVTIYNCTFDFEDVTKGSAVATRFRQSYNILIDDCKVEGGFSLLWATGVEGLKVEKTEVKGVKEGISLGTSTPCEISECIIEASDFGVRADASSTGSTKIENTKINAEQPVIIRSVTGTYDLTAEKGNEFDAGENKDPVTIEAGNGTVNYTDNFAAMNGTTNTYYNDENKAKADAGDNDYVYPVVNGSVDTNNPIQTPAPSAPPSSEPTTKPSSGNGISVKYNGGNSFSTSNPAVPTGVEIDGVPVTFNGTGSNFSVGCISSDAKWVTVRWNSTTVTTNFTPDGLVECTTVSIPKTGDMSFWAAIAQFLGF